MSGPHQLIRQNRRPPERSDRLNSLDPKQPDAEEHTVPPEWIPPDSPPTLLFLSYNGILEPLMKSQGLPYLRGLARWGVKVHLLTFEKTAFPGSPPGSALRRDLMREGVAWTWLRYHERPPFLSTFCDVIRAWYAASRIVHRSGVDIIEARGTIPAGIGYPLARFFHRRFLFNVRGILAEENIDAGRWRRNHPVVRWVSRSEKQWIMRADAVIVLTGAMKRLLAGMDYLPRPRRDRVTVIPCCVDSDRFLPPSNPSNAMEDGPVFVYAGSLGGYYLVREMFDFFAVAADRWPRARFRLLVNGFDDVANEAVEASGLDPERIEVETVDHEAVPARLAASSVGLIFARPSFARVGMSPTKLAEYLACGLPVVATREIGDIDSILGEDRTGVVVQNLNREAYEQACERLAELLDEGQALSQRCRESAIRRFGIQRGLSAYREVLGNLGFSRWN